jgi:hypothetical protein
MLRLRILLRLRARRGENNNIKERVIPMIPKTKVRISIVCMPISQKISISNPIPDKPENA